MNIDNLLRLWSGDNGYTSKPSILSTNMKVLMLIALDPGMTQVAMAVTLGVSETAIEKAVANLQNHDIVTVRKAGRRNQYDVNLPALHNHQDFIALKEFFDHVQKGFKYSQPTNGGQNVA